MIDHYPDQRSLSAEIAPRSATMVTMKISTRGRVVIPARIRKKYNLRPGDWVRFVDYGGIVFLVPTSTNSHRHGAGVPKGGPMLSEALLHEHRKERGRDG